MECGFCGGQERLAMCQAKRPLFRVVVELPGAEAGLNPPIRTVAGPFWGHLLHLEWEKDCT